MRFIKTVDGRYVDASLLTSIYVAPDIQGRTLSDLENHDGWTLCASFTCGNWILARFNTRAEADLAASDLARFLSDEPFVGSA